MAFVIGPAIGGLLVQPAVLYPSTFSSTGLFARYVHTIRETHGSEVMPPSSIHVPAVGIGVPFTVNAPEKNRLSSCAKVNVFQVVGRE